MSVIGPPEILERARSEAKRLSESTRWKAAFKDTVPETPLLVQRRDKTDADFYIVSFRSGPRVTARLRINGHTGRYAEAIGIDKVGDKLKPYYTIDQAQRQMVTLKKATAKGPLAIDPFPMWRPCAQSLSAFLPFYRFWGPGKELYFRVDGKLYSALTYGAGL
jgi:hypothetical protein